MRLHRSHLVSASVLAIGALAYALLEGPAGVTFFITPLYVGSIAVIAGLVGASRHLIPAGLPLVGWGIAALLGNEKVIPSDRFAATYMAGLAAGTLVAWLVAPEAKRSFWLLSAAISAFVGSLGYVLAFTLSTLARWPAWCVALLLWAAWELVTPLVRAHGRTPSTTDPVDQYAGAVTLGEWFQED